MGKILKAVDWYVHLTMIVSILLVIASFIVPRTGVIERTVLLAIGELGSMAAVFTFLAKLPQYIEAGATARLIKGNTTIEVGKDVKPKPSPPISPMREEPIEEESDDE